MTNPIVVTTDFEAGADRAIDRAIMLGQQLGRKVILFHGREVAPYADVDDHGLDAKMREVLPPGAQDVEFAYGTGIVPQAIAEFGGEQAAEIIAMGIARYNSIGDYFLGTAADNVIRRTSIPVLIVKKRAQREYSRIAVATDFSGFSQSALEWAAGLFPQAQLHLLHAFHVPYGGWNKADYVREQIRSYSEEQMAAFIARLPVDVQARVTSRIEHGGLSSAVNRLTEQENIDLIVLGSHGETGFRHATIGSQANELLTNTHADTVICGPRVAD